MGSSLTPKEGYSVTLKGEKPDRVPISVGSHDLFLRHYYGISARQYVHDPVACARATVAFVEEFGICCTTPGVSYIVLGCGPEVGVRWEFAGEASAAAVEGAIKSSDDLEKWEAPAEPSGYFKHYLDVNRLVREQIGDRVYLRMNVSGPFTNACFLRGLEETFIDAKTDHSFYDALMTKCVAHSKFLAKHIMAVGVDHTIMVDVFLTPELVSPDFYHEHIAPYNAQVQEYFALQGRSLDNPQAAIMGRKGDVESQRQMRALYDYAFGTKESLEIIKIGAKNSLPGRPISITLSGRMMSSWSEADTLDFLERALDYVIGEEDKLPVIQYGGIGPPDKQSALACANKMRAINRLLDTYTFSIPL